MLLSATATGREPHLPRPGNSSQPALQVLSQIFHTQVTEMPRLELIESKLLDARIDGFSKKVRISKKIMKKCVIPFLQAHREVKIVDFTVADVKKEAISAFIFLVPTHVKKVIFTRKYSSKSITSDEVGGNLYRLKVDVIGYYLKVNNVPLGDKFVCYKVNPHEPPKEFAEIVDRFYQNREKRRSKLLEVCGLDSPKEVTAFQS